MKHERTGSAQRRVLRSDYGERVDQVHHSTRNKAVSSVKSEDYHEQYA